MKKVITIIMVVIIIIVCIGIFFVIRNKINSSNEYGYGGAFILGGQSRNPSEYDSLSAWKQDLKQDMDEHNNQAESEKNNYLEIAENNAKAYMKNKYGFEPNFIDKKAEYSTSMVGGTDDAFVGWKYNYSGKVILTFLIDEKEYHVLITGNEGDRTGYDNYQFSSVEQELKKTISNIVGSNVYNVELEYGKSHEYWKNGKNTYIHNLINTFFNGYNIKEVLTNATILIEVGNDVDLGAINLDILDNTSKVMVLKYKTENDFKQAKEDYSKKTKDGYGNDKHKHIAKYEIMGFDMPEKALHISEYLTLENSKKEIKKINVSESNGTYAVKFDDISIAILPGKINDFDKFDSNGHWKKQISNVFSISYDFSLSDKPNSLQDDFDIYLYIPVKEIKDIKKLKEDSWHNRYMVGIQAKSKSDGKIVYEEAGGFTNVDIIHYNDEEYMMVECGGFYPMEWYEDYQIVLIGYSV